MIPIRHYAVVGAGTLFLFILFINWRFTNLSNDLIDLQLRVQNVATKEDQVETINNLYSRYFNAKDQFCRGNGSFLVEQMQNTQRHLNSLIQREFPKPFKRWRILHPLFDAAMSGFRYVLQPFELRNRDEAKYYMNFLDPNASCNSVTLGIGMDWSVEKKMQRKYPQCQFLGVDPIEENRKIVEAESNSRFVLAAVSNTIENKTASVLTKKYVNREIAHRAFIELLATENKGKLIDFLTIDIEGPEFTLLKDLHNKRSELPIICSFNVEIHYNIKGQDFEWEKIYGTLADIFEESHFILLKSFVGNWGREFFINVGDRECVQNLKCND
ncbi:Methyltransf-21 domain-containing protein [Aphelenchoides besseyi]|nr:Methyltransf-21 domain-containing protein [Aphelenchoides besseyi]